MTRMSVFFLCVFIELSSPMYHGLKYHLSSYLCYVYQHDNWILYFQWLSDRRKRTLLKQDGGTVNELIHVESLILIYPSQVQNEF